MCKRASRFLVRAYVHEPHHERMCRGSVCACGGGDCHAKGEFNGKCHGASLEAVVVPSPLGGGVDVQVEAADIPLLDNIPSTPSKNKTGEISAILCFSHTSVLWPSTTI